VAPLFFFPPPGYPLSHLLLSFRARSSARNFVRFVGGWPGFVLENGRPFELPFGVPGDLRAQAFGKSFPPFEGV